MKLSIFAFSFSLASVQGSSSLRATANSNNGNNDRILTSEIVLKGTVGEPSASDLDFLGKALVASYNNVHWEVGHFLTGDHAVDLQKGGPDGFLCRHCPDDDAAASASTENAVHVFEAKTPVGFLCRHCPDDDAMGTASDSLLMTAVTDDCAGLCKKDASAELEVNFCQKIQSAVGASEYLGSVTSCAIRFDSDLSPSHKASTTASETVATIDSTIVLKGVGAGDATKEEQAILAKAFVSAYNDVHWDANHFLEDAEIPFTAATEPDGFLCRHCPDDDSMGGNASNVVVVAKATNTMVLDILTPVKAFLCRHCPDDDAMGNNGFYTNADALASDPFAKKAVEVAFCNKLQNSVSHKLAATKSCSVAVESVMAIDSRAKAW